MPVLNVSPRTPRTGVIERVLVIGRRLRAAPHSGPRRPCVGGDRVGDRPQRESQPRPPPAGVVEPRAGPKDPSPEVGRVRPPRGIYARLVAEPFHLLPRSLLSVGGLRRDGQ